MVMQKDGWFLLETTPLPPADELLKVIVDIYKGRPVHIENSKLYHSSQCTDDKHILPKKDRKIILKVVETITKQKFLIAVHPNHPNFPGNPPMVIALDPLISYNVYPDHPHISTWSYMVGNNYFFPPDTLCYGLPDELSDDAYKRLEYLLAQIIIWLFRHQVWLETRKIKKPGLWIGPGALPMNPEYYPMFLNPFGHCRCGQEKPYIACHMTSDIAEREKCSLQQAKLRIGKYGSGWTTSIKIPQETEVAKLKRLLL